VSRGGGKGGGGGYSLPAKVVMVPFGMPSWMWPTPQHSPGGFAAIVIFAVVNGEKAGRIDGGENAERGLFIVVFCLY